jgi:hypothetical protein
VSNDQSPPVRKVIPYKKGGQRKSPFSEMAFQFSGTALDVAIQQREQDVEEPLPETPIQDTLPEEPPIGEPLRSDRLYSEVQLNQSDNLTPAVTHPVSSTVEEEKLPLPHANHRTETAEKHQPPRRVRLLPAKKNRPPVSVHVPPDLQAFIDRWKPFLTDTQIGICAYIYSNSIAISQEYCFTSTTKLMVAVSKTERQVKTVLNQLIDWDFLQKGETVINAPREKRGTYYKLNPDKY